MLSGPPAIGVKSSEGADGEEDGAGDDGGVGLGDRDLDLRGLRAAM
jgi:hypothetical protein